MMNRNYSRVSLLLFMAMLTFSSCSPKMRLHSMESSLNTDVSPIPVIITQPNSITHTFNDFGISLELPEEWKVILQDINKKEIHISADHHNNGGITSLITIFKDTGKKAFYENNYEELTRLIKNHTNQDMASYSEKVEICDEFCYITYLPTEPTEKYESLEHLNDSIGTTVLVAHFTHGEDFYFLSLMSQNGYFPDDIATFKVMLNTFAFAY